MRTFVKIILIGCYVFFMGMSRPAKKNQQSLAPAKVYVDPLVKINEALPLLQEGDLVFRLNTDPLSQYIKNFSRLDKKYSHAGIVVFENGYPFIYHIVNGEENPGEKLRRDSLHKFCNPRKNYGFGVYRYNFSATEKKALHTLLKKWYKQHISFDNTFNLYNNDSMYCSELISKALARATNKRIQIASVLPTASEAAMFAAYAHLPYSYVANMPVVPIDNLYLQTGCNLVMKYEY